MSFRWWRRKPAEAAVDPEASIRRRYESFRTLLTLNNECLEVLAGLQEDLQFIPPRRDIVQNRVDAIYEKAEGIVRQLEDISGARFGALWSGLAEQRREVERYIAELQEMTAPRLAVSLREITAEHAAEAGGKAAVLAEIKNRMELPAPGGFVLTTEAYRQFCGIPLWRELRDVFRTLDLEDSEALKAASERIMRRVMALPMPRAVEVAITERARLLDPAGAGLAVRSSAVGEAGEKAGRTYAGQFLTILNAPPDQALEAYREVIAARFSEQAIFYRLSTGVAEVDAPLAVLFLPMVAAAASGIMYTRDPANPRNKVLWVTATRGLGPEIASGRMPADLFILSRKPPFPAIERQVVEKPDQLVAQAGGGLARADVPGDSAAAAAVADRHLRTLAQWGVRLEQHFGAPQDVEWALDRDDRLWILQSRPLALVDSSRTKAARVRAAPVLSGGRTVYPGRVSGPVYLAEDANAIRSAPEGAIVFVRRPSPAMVEFFTRIGALVADSGNVTGHVAALLREFKVPSVILMQGAFERLRPGDPVSLDAVQAKLYPGAFWPRRAVAGHRVDDVRARSGDAIGQRLLALNLVDPSGVNFRPSRCRSTHDVLRYCHEKAVAAMFEVNDLEAHPDSGYGKRLDSSVPMDLVVLDLGGGMSLADPRAAVVTPAQIVSRPFQSLWKGVTHPRVTWTRAMPASLSDLASVMASSLTPQSGAIRGLGERSYLLVAAEYLNLNSRLAYHFALVDASLSDQAAQNYIAFRFMGGGATWSRRNLRACFVEACLAHFGFLVDRRGDLVNAWFRRGSPEETDAKLDILGRMIACTSQLDMYMSTAEVMNWYVRQFIEGNYSFRADSPAG
ncbi:MAG: hypothetical protein KIT09_17105 [Bryobacteraceae bacterium]|nr:hypothetical protein [Bryobacteraceae bacterium]